MKEAVKNTIIAFYKSGIKENIDLADVIMDTQKHIPLKQLEEIDQAIVRGRAFNSRYSWKFPSLMNRRILQKSYDKSVNK
jgi:hypothetical protein